MAKTIVKPKLSLGNQLYLYRLLRDALGCGKQTLMPGVEEALADDDMAAVDLGFENTRELLEALESCVQLTVFKGGRIYATVIAQPAWDEALAAGEPKQKATAKGAKSWKKKKGDKTLKAVKPKHVKRPEPKAEVTVEAKAAQTEKPAPAPDAAAIDAAESSDPASQAPAAASEVAPSHKARATSDSDRASQAKQPASEDATEADVEIRNETVFTLEDEQPTDADQVDGSDSNRDAADAAVEEHAQPAISLTVIYDPENSNAGIQTIESNPDAINEMRAKVEAETEPQTEAEAKTTPNDHVVSAAPSAGAAQAESSDNASAAPSSTSSSTQGTTSPEPEADRKHAAGSSAKAKVKAEAEAETKPRSAPKPKHKPKPSSAQRPKQSADTESQHEPAAPAPSAHAKSTVPTSAAPAKPSAPVPMASAQPSTPKIPEGYPIDFTTEVFCPGALLSDLSQMLPYGADILGIVGEYYWIARENGSIDAQRNRATFPLRYTHNGERHEATIRIRRNTDGGMGAAWAIDLVKSAD